MKVVVIHGQTHHGNTCKFTEYFLNKLNCARGDIQEITVNKVPPCVGCFQCIMEGEDKCPHFGTVNPMIQAIEQADVIVFSSPTYCYSMTAQMKALVDHMAYRWMIHRPWDMRHKIGVAISTAAGAGQKNAVKDIRRQFFWWSVGKTYGLQCAIWANGWDSMPEKRKKKNIAKAEKLAAKVNKKFGHVKPGLKAKLTFAMMKKVHSGKDGIPVETEWWKNQYW